MKKLLSQTEPGRADHAPAPPGGGRLALGPMLVPLVLVAGGFGSSGSCGEAQARLRGPSPERGPSYAAEGGAEDKAPKAKSALPASAPSSLPNFAQNPPTPSDPDALPSIEDPTALLSFFEGLRYAEAKRPSGRVAVLQLGDSHTAADIGTSQLRHHLQKRFGDAGRGFMLPGRPFRAYYQRDASFGSEGEWEIQNGLKHTAQEPFGLAGIRTYSDSVKSSAWVGTCDSCEAGNKVSRFEIFYRKSPQGGALKLLLDDEPLQEISTRSAPHEDGDEILGGYWELSVPDGAHQLTLKPSGTGTVDLYGVVMERDEPGVVLDAIGINGAQAMHLLRWDWGLISEQLARRDPKLVILAYGTNESANTSFSPEQHQKDVAALIANVKSAVPGASILVLGPPDRGIRERKDCERTIRKGRGRNRKKVKVPRLSPDGKIPEGCEWKTPTIIPEIVAAQRKAAQSQGVAFFDTYRAMGGSGSIDLWATLDPPLAGRDRTHLSRDGYKLNADILFEAMMRAYEDYLAYAPPLPTFEEMKEEAGRIKSRRPED